MEPANVVGCFRRNEMIIGSKAIFSKQVGAMAVQGDDPKKFAAAMVEYNRQKELGSAAPKGQAPKASTRKRNKMKVRLSSAITRSSLTHL